MGPEEVKQQHATVFGTPVHFNDIHAARCVRDYLRDGPDLRRPPDHDAGRLLHPGTIREGRPEAGPRQV